MSRASSDVEATAPRGVFIPRFCAIDFASYSKSFNRSHPKIARSATPFSIWLLRESPNLADSSVELLSLLEHLDHLPDPHPPRLFVLCILESEHNRIDVGAVQRPEEGLRLFVLLERFEEILRQFRTAGRAVGSVPSAVSLRFFHLPKAGRLHSSLPHQRLSAFGVDL